MGISKAATRLTTLLTPAGPGGTRAQLRAVVRIIHDAASQAPTEVGRITGLHRAAEIAASRPVYVVDRPGFQAANRQLFTRLITAHLPDLAGGTSPLQPALAFLSTRVLGQYDPFSRHLLFVAPNMVHLERHYGLDAMDFRLWVALHETTHAVQFAAAPWLAEYFADLTAQLLQGLNGAETSSTLSNWLNASVRNESDTPLLHQLFGERQQDDLDRVTALMSLLEGHADVVMDAISPARLPSVRRIRACFDRRRNHPTRLEALMRRAFGIDDKLAQYQRGAKFVEAIIAEVGHAGFNRVFQSPSHLPTFAEISAPAEYLARIDSL